MVETTATLARATSLRALRFYPASPVQRLGRTYRTVSSPTKSAAAHCWVSAFSCYTTRTTTCSTSQPSTVSAALKVPPTHRLRFCPLPCSLSQYPKRCTLLAEHSQSLGIHYLCNQTRGIRTPCPNFLAPRTPQAAQIPINPEDFEWFQLELADCLERRTYQKISTAEATKLYRRGLPVSNSFVFHQNDTQSLVVNLPCQSKLFQDWPVTMEKLEAFSLEL